MSLQAYSVGYTVNSRAYDELIDAKDIKSVKNKLARKHKTSPRSIKIIRSRIVGYY